MGSGALRLRSTFKMLKYVFHHLLDVTGLSYQNILYVVSGVVSLLQFIRQVNSFTTWAAFIYLPLLLVNKYFMATVPDSTPKLVASWRSEM